MKKTILIMAVCLVAVITCASSGYECSIAINEYSLRISWSPQQEMNGMNDLSNFFSLFKTVQEYYSFFEHETGEKWFDCYYNENDNFICVDQYEKYKKIVEYKIENRPDNKHKIMDIILKTITATIPDYNESGGSDTLTLYMISIPKNVTGNERMFETEIYYGAEMGFLDNKEYVFSYAFRKKEIMEYCLETDHEVIILNEKKFERDTIDTLFLSTIVQ
ncbi:MAG: hypothetical protein JW881_00110 [Spirochaetales bacterium]|nr:hypothetical protein [Spirochaetales bacterium]